MQAYKLIVLYCILYVLHIPSQPRYYSTTVITFSALLKFRFVVRLNQARLHIFVQKLYQLKVQQVILTLIKYFVIINGPTQIYILSLFTNTLGKGCL